MNTQSPAEVLNALARGVNPASGERLEASGIWQQVVIAEALRAGAAALEQHPPHVRAPSAANVGQPWTPQEEHDLLTSFAAGTALPEIASRHQRSLTAIEARLERLGKITAGQRVTRNRFTAA
ncbi:MAG TPA: hypothetical protein PK681_08775 [Steroidobacteraceae bacterium]|nr:hypothetical protein [Steroidobacteraceae bacterium]HQW09354.1 hypothetical protein [Steroidobacteraceae bacterium]HQX47501.1 hypothetical protein [Steroidobacteraceae bacterium]HQX79381.1 hypothetical protein [Steroidobacteraceae bacterium]HQZ80699.1 hypothetical protein [Steroidobacteraceae bacterium]